MTRREIDARRQSKTIGPAAAKPGQGGKARKPRRDEALIGDIERFVEDIRSGTYGSQVGALRFSALLTAQLAGRPPTPEERERALEIARQAVEGRVRAIVENKRHGACERAAAIAVACAESLALAADRARGADFIRIPRERYPRHYAFRQALDAATWRSPLLPPPSAKR